MSYELKIIGIDLLGKGKSWWRTDKGDYTIQIHVLHLGLLS